MAIMHTHYALYNTDERCQLELGTFPFDNTDTDSTWISGINATENKKVFFQLL